jgi:hypothetical protein
MPFVIGRFTHNFIYIWSYSSWSIHI